jgi:hypothetical protein
VPVTGQNLIDAASDLADMVSDPHVSTATWLRWANRGQEKLWRKLSTLYAGWGVTPQDFTLAGGVGGNTFALTAVHRQVLGVSKDPDNLSQRQTLRRRNFDERDEQYRRTFAVIGQTLEVQPFEYSAGNYRVYYVAGPTALAAVGSTLDPAYEPYVEYLETYMAIKAKSKEESDTTDLLNDIKEIWEEIEGVAAQRNAAIGETIVDTERTGGVWPWLVRP